MKKEDFQVGMIVRFGADRFGPDNMPRGVILKLNPKRAQVKALDKAGKWPAGAVWRCPYGGLVPEVASEALSNEMTMRSFEKPGDEGIKAWSGRQKKQAAAPRAIKPEDTHIVRSIHEIYERLEGGSDSRELYCKIHLLFRAIGREISKQEAEERCKEMA